LLGPAEGQLDRPAPLIKFGDLGGRSIERHRHGNG
jgi:hypothetical protein